MGTVSVSMKKLANIIKISPLDMRHILCSYVEYALNYDDASSRFNPDFNEETEVDIDLLPNYPLEEISRLWVIPRLMHAIACNNSGLDMDKENINIVWAYSAAYALYFQNSLAESLGRDKLTTNNIVEFANLINNSFSDNLFEYERSLWNELKRFIINRCSVSSYNKEAEFPSSDEIATEITLIRLITQLESKSSSNIAVCKTHLVDIFVDNVMCEKFVCQCGVLLYTKDCIEATEKCSGEPLLYHALKTIFSAFFGIDPDTNDDFKSSLKEYYSYYKDRVE